MEIPLTTYKKLLGDTARVNKHQKELAILKGENFNVFSILKMEYRENETHSAFLGELLNPEGTHSLGTIFLKCFIEILGIEDHIDIKSAKVFLEKSIGARDDSKTLGGRIDIFIRDDANNTICIENKIHAADQNVQIARYCNYNTEKNKVFYLTLEGEMPSKGSYLNKIPDQDFFNISYKIEVLEWLEQCQKEATQFPILRESINQYGILIKKLTNQLSDQTMEQEVKDIIIANYKAARVVAGHVGIIESEYTEKFISEIVDQLKKKLSEAFAVEMSDNLNKPWTGISIRHKNWPIHVIVKMEGASKIPWATSIYGVHAPKTKFDRLKINDSLKDIELLQSGFNETEHWPCYRTILDFSTTDLRARLFKTSEKKALVKDITDKLSELANLCEVPFSKLEMK